MRIEDGRSVASASLEHLVVAYYVTGHGFGHATRVVEVRRSSYSLHFFVFDFWPLCYWISACSVRSSIVLGGLEKERDFFIGYGAERSHCIPAMSFTIFKIGSF